MIYEVTSMKISSVQYRVQSWILKIQIVMFMNWNHVAPPCRVMNTYDDYSEEELSDYIIQLSIQDSCQDAFLKSAARYGSHI